MSAGQLKWHSKTDMIEFFFQKPLAITPGKLYTRWSHEWQLSTDQYTQCLHRANI